MLSSEAFHTNILNMWLGETMDMGLHVWGAKNEKHCQKQESHPLIVCVGAAEVWKLNIEWLHFRGNNL